MNIIFRKTFFGLTFQIDKIEKLHWYYHTCLALSFVMPKRGQGSLAIHIGDYGFAVGNYGAK